ncbi:MAG: hypothetical protein Q8L29_02670 [archaeon]|nr:hypothetical protein [archaeon]
MKKQNISRAKPAKKKLTQAEEDIFKGLKAEEKEVLKAKKQKDYNEGSSYEPTVNTGDLIEIEFDTEDFEPTEGGREIIRGKVLGIYDNGMVPDIDEEVEGTTQDPAILLEIYTADKNDRWKSTEKLTAYKMSELKRATISYKE